MNSKKQVGTNEQEIECLNRTQTFFDSNIQY